MPLRVRDYQRESGEFFTGGGGRRRRVYIFFFFKVPCAVDGQYQRARAGSEKFFNYLISELRIKGEREAGGIICPPADEGLSLGRRM